MTKTVLLVEDDASLRDCLSDLLEEQGGFTVRASKDGADALQLIDEGQAFDVLLTDRRMPAMGGEELIRRLRARGLRQRMILMTGDIIVPDMLPGVDAIVHKPMSIIELVDLINDLTRAPAAQ